MKVLMIAYDMDMTISFFPLGLAYLSSAIRNAGHEVEVYQQDVYHWPDSHLTSYLDSHSFDVVEVSVIGAREQHDKLMSLSAAIGKSVNRNKFKFTIGGHGPASDPEYYLRKTNADVVGIGEGEITFVELLDAFCSKRTLNSVDGIAYLDEDGGYVRTDRRKLISNLDEIAWPAYDLFDMTHYTLMPFPNKKKAERGLPMLSGRGCIFACNFCYRLDKGFRPRRAESIIEEILFLKEKYNISYIAFVDELLMSSRERTIELCRAFIDAGLNIHWDCNGRLNFADLDVLQLMKQAGCVFINYGIESMDDATREVMHKNLSKEMIINGVENTKKAGITPGLNIIFGNINEPLSALDEAVDFLIKYDEPFRVRRIDTVIPYPGTELFEYGVKAGLIKDTEDFYSNKLKDRALLAVNFTEYDDETVYKALYEANMKLFNNYYDSFLSKQPEIYRQMYKNMYLK